MKYLTFYYESHPSLLNHNFENEVVEFLKKRINFFFEDYNINIFSQNQFPKKNDGTVIFLSLLNPILDEVLLGEMVKSSKNVERIIKPKGAIPGTAPILVSKKRLIGSDSGYYFQKSNILLNGHM